MTETVNPLKHFKDDELLWFLSEGLMLTDMNGVILSLNDAGSAVFGFGNYQELLGKNIGDLFWKPEDFNIFLEAIKKTREIREYLIFGRRRDGRPAYIQACSRLHPIDAEEPEAIATMFKDVSERELFKRALDRSERRYRTLFDNISEGYVRFSADNKVVFINPAGARMLGFDSPMEIVGSELADLWEDENAKKDYLERLHAAGGLVNEKAVFKLRNGRRVTLALSERLVRNREGEIVGSDALYRDVTEQQTLQEQLAETSQKYYEVAANSSDIISITDINGIVSYLSPAYEKILGYRAEEETGKPIERTAIEEDGEKIREAGEKLRAGAPVSDLEIKTIASDGREVILSWNKSPVRDASGEVTSIIGIARDITERKHAEEELRKERDLSTSLIENSPTYFVAIDANGNTLMMNKAMLNALGYSQEEVMGKDYLTTFVPERDREMLSNVFKSLVNIKRPALNENHILTKDGRELLVEWHGSPVLGTGGNLKHFFGVGIDITERRRAKEKLREQHNFTEAVLNATTALIMVIDKDGRIVTTNPAIQSLTGYSEEELRGVPMWEILSPKSLAEQAKAHISEIFGGGRPTSGNYPILCKSGEERMAAWHSDFIRDASGNPKWLVSIGRDITETLNLRREVEQTEQQYRDLVENSPDIIIRIDASTKIITFAGGAGEQLTGYTPEDARGKSILDFVHPEDRAKTKEALEQTAAGKVIVSFVNRVITRDGDAIYLSTNARPITNEKGETGEIQLNSKDITPLINLQEQLKQYSEKLEKKVEERTTEMREAMEKWAEEERHTAQLRDIAPLAFIGTDENGLICQWNRAAQEMFGYSSEEVVGKSPAIIVPPDRMHEFESVATGIRRAEKIKGFETMGLTKDGRRVDVKLGAVSLMDENGRHVRGLCLIENITEQKAARREIEQARARLQMILEEIPEYGIFSTDQNLIINYFGPGCERLLGWEAKEVAYKKEVHILAMQPAATLDEALKGLRPSSNVIPMRRKDGATIEVEAIVKPIRDKKGKPQGFIIVIRDISREREMIDRLFEDAHHKALGAIIVGLAAEFNEMLTRLEQQAALAHEDPGFASHLAAAVRDEVRRAGSLVDVLKRFSHPAPQPFQLLDAAEVVDEVTQMLQGEFQISGVRLVKTYHKVSKTLMRKEDIQHALLNLLVAGMNSAGKGGMVEVVVRQEGKSLILTVKNNGEGIESEYLNRIFDPKFWIERSAGNQQSKTLSASLGLGLITTRKVAEEHNGTIEVESEIGVGTSFTIKLPVRTTRRGRKTTRIISSARVPARGQAQLPLKVLIADDEKHIRSILSFVAKEWHHIPDTAGGLNEVRNLCLDHKFDVLFLDAGLGDQADLTDTIAFVRTSNPKVRVILIAENPPNLPRNLKALCEKVLTNSFSVEEIHKLLSD